MDGMGSRVHDAAKRFSGFGMRITKQTTACAARLVEKFLQTAVCQGCCVRTGRELLRLWRRSNDGEGGRVGCGGRVEECWYEGQRGRKRTCRAEARHLHSENTNCKFSRGTAERTDLKIGHYKRVAQKVA